MIVADNFCLGISLLFPRMQKCGDFLPTFYTTMKRVAVIGVFAHVLNHPAIIKITSRVISSIYLWILMLRKTLWKRVFLDENTSTLINFSGKKWNCFCYDKSSLSSTSWEKHFGFCYCVSFFSFSSSVGNKDNLLSKTLGFKMRIGCW